MKKVLLFICTLLMSVGEVIAQSTPTFTATAPKALPSGWYQIKWISTDNSTTTPYTEDELTGKFVTNYSTDVVVNEKCYSLKIDDAPSSVSEHASTFIYYNITTDNGDYGTSGNLQSANGRYIQQDGSSALDAPSDKNFIIYFSSGSYPYNSVITTATSGSSRVSFIPLGKSATPYIGTTEANKYPMVQFSPVNLSDIGLVAWKVIINGISETLAYDNTQITYTGSGIYGLNSVYNNGTFFLGSDVTPTEEDLSIPSITGANTTVEIDSEAKKIKVYYSNLTYTLTDVNGAKYTGKYYGEAGETEPTLTGCYGLSLSNKVWDGASFSATINFPFPISSNGKTNYTYIANYNDNNFIWFVQSNDATKVYVNKESHTPNNKTYTRFDWSIEPVFSDLSFTFKIKNRATGTYVYSTATTNSHSGAVTLSETGTELTYINDASYNRWVLPTGRQLSINSSGDNNGNQELGTYDQHNGTAIKIVERTDFETLIANFGTAAAAFWPYNGKIGDGLGKYSGENAAAMQSAYTAAMSDQTTYTAAEISANTTLLANPASKLTLNLPATGKFYRIKGYSNNYITSNTANSNASMNGTASANNIIFYNASKNLVFFGSGYGLYKTHTVAPAGSTLNAYTFSEGAQLSHYYITSNATGIGTYCYDNTASGTKLDRNTVPVTSGSYQTDWTLEEVTTTTLTLNNGGDGYYYATLCLPFDVTLNAAAAYTLTMNSSKTGLTLSDAMSEIEAGTPVFIRHNAETLTATLGTGYATTPSTSTSLTGCYVSTAVDANTVYTLGKENGHIGFYKYSGTSIAANRAYVSSSVVDEVSARGFALDFGELTGISNVESQKESNVIYDMQGRKVQKAGKGLYIVNGKKVLY